MFRFLSTFVLVYHLQTEASDGCFVFAENSCSGVPFADGFLRWVFRSRGGLSFWCTLCRRMGVSFSLTTFVLVYPFADRGERERDGCFVLAEDVFFPVYPLQMEASDGYVGSAEDLFLQSCLWKPQN